MKCPQCRTKMELKGDQYVCPKDGVTIPQAEVVKKNRLNSLGMIGTGVVLAAIIFGLAIPSGFVLTCFRIPIPFGNQILGAAFVLLAILGVLGLLGKADNSDFFRRR